MALQRNAFDVTASHNQFISEKAIEIAREDLASEEAARGWLPPNRIVPPLANGGYSKEEYAMMERDRGKYILYAAAIRDAVFDMIERKIYSLNQSNSSAKSGGDHHHNVCECENIKNISSTNTKVPSAVKIPFVALVPGCGRGRLIQFVLDAVNYVNTIKSKLGEEVEVVAHVWALDANPIAISSCSQRFNDNKNVYIVDKPLPVFPGMTIDDLPPELKYDSMKSKEDTASSPLPISPLKNCDLIVSELLGSFVDNEFMTAVSKTLKDLFLKEIIKKTDNIVSISQEKQEFSCMIPDSYTTYVAPMSCPRAVDLLRSLSRPLDAPYNMSLSDDVVVWGDRFEKLWSGKCYEPQHAFEGSVNKYKIQNPKCSTTCFNEAHKTLKGESNFRSKRDFSIKINHDLVENKDKDDQRKLSVKPVCVIHGLAGFFTCHLYGDIFIDTRPELFPIFPECHQQDPSSSSSSFAAASGSLPLNPSEDIANVGRNSMHWEAFFFPFPVPLHVELGSHLSMRVSQLSYPPSLDLSLEKNLDSYHPSLLDEMWYTWDACMEEDTTKHESSNLQQTLQLPEDSPEMIKSVSVDGRAHRITLGCQAGTSLDSVSSTVNTRKHSACDDEDESQFKHSKLLKNARQWKEK